MLDRYDYKVDFKGIKHFYEVHQILKRDLDFPDYYGGNLYGLWDCLTDQLLSGLTYIEVYNTESIPEDFYDIWERCLKVIRETKHAYDDKFSDKFFVTIVHQDGSREEIE